MVGLDRSGRLREGEMRGDAIGETLNLGVSTTHGRGGFAAQRARQCRVELVLLGVFMGQNPFDQQSMCGGQRLQFCEIRAGNQSIRVVAQ